MVSLQVVLRVKIIEGVAKTQRDQWPDWACLSVGPAGFFAGLYCGMNRKQVERWKLTRYSRRQGV